MTELNIKNLGLALSLFAVTMASACSSDVAGSMDDPAPAVKVVKVESMDKSISGLDNGIYDLEFYAKTTQADDACWVKAGLHQSTSLLQSGVWTKGFVRGVDVTDGTLNISYGSLTNTPVNCIFDGVRLVKTETPHILLKGGDISMLPLVEANGGKYYDADGSEKDAVALLKESGMNIARLRLYNNPGESVTYTENGNTYTYSMPAGCQDETSILALAKRAKAAGMQIELTFHYSDFWTNGGMQFKPKDWQDLSSDALKDKVYAYTKSFLEKMVAQGTAPEYVSLGNEIQSGLLFGYITTKGEQMDEVNGYCGNMQSVASFLGQGSKAVREVCPEAKVVVHLTMSKDVTMESNFKWFFTEMQNNGLDYDVIGASYYPYWTGLDAATACSQALSVAEQFDKNVLFMETGYAWNPTLEDGTPGQISNNGTYKDMTREGQRRFLLELTQQINNISSHRILGYIYWDPVYVNAPNCGWVSGGKNVTSNSTLFDFQGKVLPAVDAMKFNY